MQMFNGDELRTLSVCAPVMDKDYKLSNLPFVIDIPIRDFCNKTGSSSSAHRGKVEIPQNETGHREKGNSINVNETGIKKDSVSKSTSGIKQFFACFSFSMRKVIPV